MVSRLILIGLFLVGCFCSCQEDVIGDLPADYPEVMQGDSATSLAEPINARDDNGRGGTAADPEVLPSTGSIGEGQLDIVLASGKKSPIIIKGIVFGFAEKMVKGHRLLTLTTRPAGTSNWPWIRLETWVPGQTGLAEWVGRSLRVYKLECMMAPGLSPWNPQGRSEIKVTGLNKGRLHLELSLVLQDPVDGETKKIIGKVTAVPAQTR